MDEGDPANRFKGNGQSAAFKIKQFYPTVDENFGRWQRAREQRALEGADDYLFAGAGHGRPVRCE